MKNSISFFVAILCATLTKAATIVDVLPLTNRIIAVHFDDGYVNHHGIGEARSSETAVVDTLNVNLATQVSQYGILSSNDANYASSKTPTEAGRKTKPTNFTWLCEGWNGNCVNSSPDHAKEHWVYLYLLDAMQTGKTYTLNTNALATNGNTWTFTFQENENRSEAIHVNMEGYNPDASQKFGYLYAWAGDKGGLDFSSLQGQSFQLVKTSDKSVVFTGNITFRKGKNNIETGQFSNTPNGNFLSADVWECDFTSFSTDGDYRLVVPTVGCSFDFHIGANAYNNAFYTAVRGLYHNRSGIALEAPYTSFTRQAPHHVGITPDFNGRLKYSTFRTFDMSAFDGADTDKAPIEAKYKGELTETWGWYQDAGDWDTYYTHSSIPAWLLMLVEANPTKYADGTLNIPESGNGLPDLLDEALWLPHFYYRARKEITDKGWGTGGVPGARVFGDLWGADTPNDIGRGSWQDTDRDWYMLGEDPWMTYKYAGMAAHIAWLMQQNNWTAPNGIDWQNEAITAWNWAKANTKAGDEAPKFDFVLANIRMYAAVQLLRLTGESSYNTQYAQDASIIWPANVESISGEDLLLATVFYAQLPSNLGTTTTKNKARDLINYSANEDVVVTPAKRACRWGGNFYFPMLIGQGTTPFIEAGVTGYFLNRIANPTKAASFLNGIRTTADYFLGNNPLNICWVTGVGERDQKEIFHLDWWYGGKEAVLPGVTSYGQTLSGYFGPLGPWNHMWATQFVYPNIESWPGHERWFSQRTSPFTAEFTVHQNTRQTALVYGLLSDGLGTSSIQETDKKGEAKVLMTAFFEPNQRILTIKNPEKETIQQVTLYNSTGQVVQTTLIKNNRDEVLTVDVVKGIAAGFHAVEVRTTNNQVHGFKILMH
jgi:endoglucanase